MSEALDHWLPDPAIRTPTTGARRTRRPTRCGRRRRASAWRRRAGSGRLVGWRIPGVQGSLTYHELFRAYPFTRARRDPSTASSPACAGGSGRSPRDYPALDGPEAFAAWDEPGTVRVAFAHWRPRRSATAGRELWSEARVQPVDTGARLRLKAVWAVVGPFERLVGAEPLALAGAGARSSRRLECCRMEPQSMLARAWTTRSGSRPLAACSRKPRGRRSTGLPR